MTEFLDVYNANREYIGIADRNVAHSFGLWHKTVHCWIVIYIEDIPHLVFQRRAYNLNDNAGKLYTTASGHVSAGETLEVSFSREIEQEIGLSADVLSPKHLHETVWIADIKRKDGSLFVDRVFCNTYYSVYTGNISDFKFSDGEVDGAVAIKLKELIPFLQEKLFEIPAIEFDGNKIKFLNLSKSDFVLNLGETLLGKYGGIANSIALDIS